MTILDFLLCEDIRHEVDNKMTLIGVLATQQLTIRIPPNEEDKWPRTTKLSAFIRLRIEDSDMMPDKFELQFIYEDKVISSLKGVIPSPPTTTKLSKLNLVLSSNNFPIPGPGRIVFRLTLFHGEHLIFEGEPGVDLSINVLHQNKIIK